MTHPKIPLAQMVIQLFKAKKISHIVISPGSRNAPLTLGFASDSFFKCYSIIDERCAAFFALGIAQQIHHPVALVCTSGSALLNYYPAICEAYYSNIPLIVLSADRPKHLLNVGDGQTINQKNVFANHILYSTNLKINPKKDHNTYASNNFKSKFLKSKKKINLLIPLFNRNKYYNELEINKACNFAISNKGPVHINVPFNEPLYETTQNQLKISKNFVPKEKLCKLSAKTLNNCTRDWNSASKIMILVGSCTPNYLSKEWLHALASDCRVIVFTETTSNLYHPKFFNSIDKIIAPLTPELLIKLQPEILITLGGLLISKKIKTFLRSYQPQHHWHIGKNTANDTFFCLNRVINTNPNYFFSKIIPKIRKLDSNYQSFWSQIKLNRDRNHNEYLSQIAFSDLKVFNSILIALPKKIILHLSNSSAARYIQLFNIDSSLEVFCNRGTSGIEGSTSTAMGCAIANKKQTVLITGDLSFFYDSNALWNSYIPSNFRIIVINNQGGGIFRILPAPKGTTLFNTYFETTHNYQAMQLCEMYHFKYLSATSEKELETSLETFFYDHDRPKLLEIFTPREENDKVLLSYFKHLI